MFREFRLSAAFTEFVQPVLVGICHLKASDGGPFAPPDDATEARLQLAHPDPNNSDAIEILPKVNAPFLACADLLASNDEFTSVIGARRPSHLGQFASAAGSTLRHALGPVLQTLLPSGPRQPCWAPAVWEARPRSSARGQPWIRRAAVRLSLLSQPNSHTSDRNYLRGKRHSAVYKSTPRPG